MNPHHEDLIRERAYQLWEDEGRPEGASERHWQQAVAAVTKALSPGTSDGKGSPAQEALAESSAAQPADVPAKPRRKAV